MLRSVILDNLISRKPAQQYFITDTEAGIVSAAFYNKFPIEM